MKENEVSFDIKKFFAIEGNRKRFNQLRDVINEEIYKGVEYDRKRHNLIVRVSPTMIKINFQITNKGFMDTYGYAIYSNNRNNETIIDLDEKILVKRIKDVIQMLNTINKKKILDVI